MTLVYSETSPPQGSVEGVWGEEHLSRLLPPLWPFDEIPCSVLLETTMSNMVRSLLTSNRNTRADVVVDERTTSDRGRRNPLRSSSSR